MLMIEPISSFLVKPNKMVPDDDNRMVEDSQPTSSQSPKNKAKDPGCHARTSPVSNPPAVSRSHSNSTPAKPIQTKYGPKLSQFISLDVIRDVKFPRHSKFSELSRLNGKIANWSLNQVRQKLAQKGAPVE